MPLLPLTHLQLKVPLSIFQQTYQISLNVQPVTHTIRQHQRFHLTYHKQLFFLVLHTLNLEVFPGAFQYVLNFSLVHTSSFFWTVSCSCFLLFLTTSLASWILLRLLLKGLPFYFLHKSTINVTKLPVLIKRRKVIESYQIRFCFFYRLCDYVQYLCWINLFRLTKQMFNIYKLTNFKVTIFTWTSPSLQRYYLSESIRIRQTNSQLHICMSSPVRGLVTTKVSSKKYLRKLLSWRCN